MSWRLLSILVFTYFYVQWPEEAKHLTFGLASVQSNSNQNTRPTMSANDSERFDRLSSPSL